MVSVKKAHWDLVEVQALAAARKVRWSASRAIDPLREVCGSQWKQHGLRILGKLDEGAFHGTVDQRSIKFDVYGVRHEGIGWYVKLSIDNVLDAKGAVTEQLFTISCHPLERPLRTSGGQVQP